MDKQPTNSEQQLNQSIDAQPDSRTGTQTNDAVASTAPERGSKKQFGIAALFWMTFIVGLSLSYLQQLKVPDALLGGLITVTIGLVAGLVVGLATKRLSDAIFWSTLIAAFGYMSVAKDAATVMHLQIAWATLGAITGAVGATVATEKPIPNTIVCALVALATMLGFWLVGKHQLPVGPFGLDVDLVAAPLVGFAISIFIRILSWTEVRHKTPRYLTATWLMAVVIAGNMLAG